MYTAQMVSSSHHYLKAVSLGKLLGAGKASGRASQGQGRGWGASDCPEPALGSTRGQSSP